MVVMADFEQYVYDDEKKVSERMCLFVINVAKQAISRSGVFSVGLSGGFFSVVIIIIIIIIYSLKIQSNHPTRQGCNALTAALPYRKKNG